MTKTMMTLMAAMIAVSSLSIVPVKASVEGLSTFDSSSVMEKRRKPRVPGGSGCDDPQDIIEHPECTP